MSATTNGLIRAGSVDELRELGCKVVQVGHAPVLVLHHAGDFHAMDNRCPHMGFPLHQGDVHDGLLDCHWHHARFDVTCGATLDPWADDVDTYRIVVEGDAVFVDPTPPTRDAFAHGMERLRRGLEDRLTLVTAKAVLEHVDAKLDPVHQLEVAARFGATERESGWSTGLSIVSCMANVLPTLFTDDRPRALVHGFTRVASDAGDKPPRRPLPRLIGSGRSRDGLRAWLRETVEVRDSDGAERVLATIVAEHGTAAALDAVLAACTDHRYADIGHTLDFAVKCAELADRFENEELVTLLFTSLVPQMVQVERMEETSAWRRPVDVAALVANAEARLPDLWRDGADGDVDEDALIDLILDDEPRAAIDALCSSIADGADPVSLSEAVVAAAQLRVLRFGTANEFRDWDTVHHTLTYANAVSEGMRRVPSPELFRGVLDGAMSVYLDRFLNIPAAKLPEDRPSPPDATAPGLLAIYDGRSQVDAATDAAHAFLEGGGAPDELLATLGQAILREDAQFHEYQELELAWRRLQRRGDCQTSRRGLVASARWIAAHYPTPRAREQTFSIARRLVRGELVF